MLSVSTHMRNLSILLLVGLLAARPASGQEISRDSGQWRGLVRSPAITIRFDSSIQDSSAFSRVRLLIDMVGTVQTARGPQSYSRTLSTLDISCQDARYRRQELTILNTQGNVVGREHEAAPIWRPFVSDPMNNVLTFFCERMAADGHRRGFWHGA